MGLKDVFINYKNRLASFAYVSVADQYLNAVAEEIRRTAPTQRIRENVEIESARMEGGVLKGAIKIDVSPADKGDTSSAPEARAFEYGSGIHATEGNRGKYIIKPKKAKALVFYWEKAWDHIPRTPDGRVILQSVNHPGVEARPYIDPAFKRHLNLLRRGILKASRAEIRIAFTESLNVD